TLPPLVPGHDPRRVGADGQSYRDREDCDRRKHQEMVGYAEGRRCRWQTLLSYFGGEGLPDERSGHCDSCKLWALQAGTRVRAEAETGAEEKTGWTSSQRKQQKGQGPQA